MKQIETRNHRFWRGAGAALLVALVASLGVAVRPAPAHAATGGAGGIGGDNTLTTAQRAVLRGIARDTWNFYKDDVDPNTHLPLDNLGYKNDQVVTRGAYTSAANIGVYLWAVVAANDLGLISQTEAQSEISATLTEVGKLKRTYGFLYQWYDTTTGDTIRGPNDIDCKADTTPAQDNCNFLSAVDNGWYASGLAVVRSAMPKLKSLVDSLIAPMNFGIFYDNGPQTNCNVNSTLPGNPPTGQMYGGYYTDANGKKQGPAGYHNGALYSDPRIAMYMGMGLHQMPGDVWWRSWRTLPPKQCTSDPDFSWQGQWPVPGYWQMYTDPQSGKQFNVWEGHYTYPGSDLTFIPTYAAGMFEGLMVNLVVPETTWGPQSFGLADQRLAQVQAKYATEALHYPVWGMSPSSTPDDTGGYNTYGAEGQALPPHQWLSQCTGTGSPMFPSCASEDAVTPHASFIALDVLPQEAYANIQTLRTTYSDIYRADGGFYDAVATRAFTYTNNGTTYNVAAGQVGHRDLVLDQSMIMAALDNALNDRAMQRHFADDAVSWAAHLYLSSETMSIVPGSGPPSGSAPTPELGSGELVATGLIPLGLALFIRRRRARRASQRTRSAVV